MVPPGKATLSHSCANVPILMLFARCCAGLISASSDLLDRADKKRVLARPAWPGVPCSLEVVIGLRQHSRVSRYRAVAAAVYVVAFTTVLAWWIKGDLEMGWLIGAPLLVAGAGLIGLSTAFLLRRFIPILIATGASVVLGMVFACIALQTPNGWRVDPPREMARAAAEFSQDRPAVEAAVSRVTGLPVEVMETRIETQPGWVSKEGFSFRLLRRPAGAAVVASFAAGPTDSVTFRMVEQEGQWVPVAHIPGNAGGMTLRQAAFERRFPSVPLIEVGGQGPHAPGALLLVRAARSATDWELVLFRVASKGRPLDEVNRFSRADILREFEKYVAERGLGRVGQVFMHYQPSGSYPVLFLNAPVFRFFGTLDHPAYGSIGLLAHLQDGRVKFEIDRPFPRRQNRVPDPGD